MMKIIEKRKNKKIIILTIFLLFSSFMSGCNLPYDWKWDKEEVHSSPNGNKTIILKYDWGGRPTVFQKIDGVEKFVWEYNGPGFIEDVSFCVEWNEDEECILHYEENNHKERYEIELE